MYINNKTYWLSLVMAISTCFITKLCLKSIQQPWGSIAYFFYQQCTETFHTPCEIFQQNTKDFFDPIFQYTIHYVLEPSIKTFINFPRWSTPTLLVKIMINDVEFIANFRSLFLIFPPFSHLLRRFAPVIVSKNQYARKQQQHPPAWDCCTLNSKPRWDHSVRERYCV